MSYTLQYSSDLQTDWAVDLPEAAKASTGVSLSTGGQAIAYMTSTSGAVQYLVSDYKQPGAEPWLGPLTFSAQPSSGYLTQLYSGQGANNLGYFFLVDRPNANLWWSREIPATSTTSTSFTAWTQVVIPTGTALAPAYANGYPLVPQRDSTGRLHIITMLTVSNGSSFSYSIGDMYEDSSQAGGFNTSCTLPLTYQVANSLSIQFMASGGWELCYSTNTGSVAGMLSFWVCQNPSASPGVYTSVQTIGGGAVPYVGGTPLWVSSQKCLAPPATSSRVNAPADKQGNPVWAVANQNQVQFYISNNQKPTLLGTLKMTGMSNKFSGAYSAPVASDPTRVQCIFVQGGSSSTNNGLYYVCQNTSGDYTSWSQQLITTSGWSIPNSSPLYVTQTGDSMSVVYWNNTASTGDFNLHLISSFYDTTSQSTQWLDAALGQDYDVSLLFWGYAVNDSTGTFSLLGYGLNTGLTQFIVEHDTSSPYGVSLEAQDVVLEEVQDLKGTPELYNTYRTIVTIKDSVGVPSINQACFLYGDSRDLRNINGAWYPHTITHARTHVARV